MHDKLNSKINVISKLKTPSNIKLIFSINQLPPNQLFELRVFTPNNDCIDGVNFSSDDKGNAINANGNYEISYGFSTSGILPNGLYKVGINMGFFKYTKKFYFDDWYNSPNSKDYIQIELNFEKVTIITLNEIGKVPWGKEIIIKGSLYYKNISIEHDPQASSTGGKWFAGRIIYFTGSDGIPQHAVTDGFSRFIAMFKVGNEPKSRCYIQAKYDDQDEYFNSCNSNMVYYDIIKHRTALEIRLDDLKLNPISNPLDIIDKKILEPNQFFKINGNLKDIDSNTKLKNQVINIESNFPIPIKSIALDSNGSFLINNLITPNKSGEFYIKTSFFGDKLYEKSESNIVRFTIIDNNIKENHIIKQENNKKEKSIFERIKDRENSNIERKSSFRYDTKLKKTNPKVLEKIIAKTIQAFMNGEGGTIFIGVDDDGNILGLEEDYKTLKKKNSDGFELELRQSLEKYLKDKIVNELIQINFPNIEGHEICEIITKKSPKPIILTDEGKQEFYVRIGNSSKPYSFNEFYEYCNRRFRY